MKFDALAIIGLQWGDEGKGKLVDVFAEFANWSVRYNGGNNAGHTLVIGNQKIKLNLIPCGILRPSVRCLLAAGMVIDLMAFSKEVATLTALGVDLKGRLFIDECAHLVLPYHGIIDRARELKRGKERIGTLGLGIGPAYEDRAARTGVRFAELRDWNSLRVRLGGVVEEKQEYLRSVLKSDVVIDLPAIIDSLEKAREEILPFLVNGSEALIDASREGQSVLFEGAQAALLDVTFGTVPYVTSSHTLSGGIPTSCGIPPQAVKSVLGVTKAYTTRVGEGPFPTELRDAVGEHLLNRGQEFGTVSGRARRCGWLDAVLLRRTCRINGADSLAVMKLDILSGIEKIKIAKGYQRRGQELRTPPALTSEWADLEVQYEEFEGWDDDLTAVRKISGLPLAARRYLEAIAAFSEVPIRCVGVGPERAQLIFV